MHIESSAARPAEPRFAATLAILLVFALYLTMPIDILGNFKFLIVGVSALLLMPIVAMNPHKLSRQTRLSRTLTILLALIITVANQCALGFLIYQLVADSNEGLPILLAALQIFGTNVIGFGILYWEIDRGGPVSRSQLDPELQPDADFLFPQHQQAKILAAPHVIQRSALPWEPHFVDYLYFSLTNSMAFSPSDALPISHRAKLLMGLQSFASFVMLALVIARAVSILG